MLHRSIAARLTLTLGLVAAAGFGGVGVLLYRALEHELARTNRETLMGKVQAVRHVIQDTDAADDLRALQHRLDDLRIGHGELLVWLQTRNQQVVYGGSLPRETSGPDRDGYLRAIGVDGARLDALEATLPPATPWEIQRVRVAIDAGARERLLANYAFSLAAICVLGTMLTVLLVGVATRRGLDPVNRLSRDAARITGKSLGNRLSSEHNDVEIESLAQAFNEVLDRVEAAYRQIDAFSADVSHELRSAMATIISSTQVVLMGNSSPQELRQALAGNIEELEQMKSLVNDMLLLARAEQGSRAEPLEWVEFADEADKTLRYCDVWLAEAGLTGRRVGQARVLCNPALIRRALVNLISNAVDNTERGGEITINAEPGEKGVRLFVFNPGPPLGPAELLRMFDRFVRLNRAPSATGGGHGLGLAIVRAIARMHGGTAFAEPTVDGNRVGIEISVDAVSGPAGVDSTT